MSNTFLFISISPYSLPCTPPNRPQALHIAFLWPLHLYGVAFSAGSAVLGTLRWLVYKPDSLADHSACDFFRLGFCATCLDDDLHSIFHRIFEGHLDSKQAVLVGRFGFVRFHRPTQSQ